MPGLTVDRYDTILSVQVLSLGMERVKDVVFAALLDVLREMGEDIRGIYERNDMSIRLREGLEEGKGLFPLEGFQPRKHHDGDYGERRDYQVDVENGQKTGFFLDQKYNRAAVARIAAGKRVLDCFTHTGSFGLNAAMGGAEHVTSVDISQTAIDMAAENARRNGLEGRMSFQMRQCVRPAHRAEPAKVPDYDFIILDPPAFTKSRQTVQSAIRGYREINRRAMKLLPRGGYLATCSCSHFMTDELFRRCWPRRGRLRGLSPQIEARQQCPDHPILWNVPETDYLKFYIFQVV